MRSLSRVTASFVIIASGCVGCGGSGENVYGIIDLVGRVTADEAAWKGKEAVVSGYPSPFDGNTDPIKLNLVEDLYSGTERHIYCDIPKVAVSDDLGGKLVTGQRKNRQGPHAKLPKLKNGKTRTLRIGEVMPDRRPGMSDGI